MAQKTVLKPSHSTVQKKKREQKNNKSIHKDSAGIFIPVNILLPELILGKRCILEAVNIISRQRKRRDGKFQSAS